MPKIVEYQLRPLGWENDPEEERIRFSSLDYLAASTYNSYAIFFRLQDDSDDAKAKVVETLKSGLERTLAQCRQLVGTIEKNPDNDDHSFVKKRDTTVKFIVKYFDHSDSIPSLSEMEANHFLSSKLGDTTQFVVDGMGYGEKPECLPSNNPVISAFQANFIPGSGLIFVTNSHHYANDATGWANFIHQLGENCSAIANNTPYPPWDPSNLDATRFTATDFPSASKVSGTSPPARHPNLRTHVSLLFHLPPSKASLLKTLSSPSGSWISTYDAFTSLLWRILTRHRAPLYTPSPPASTTPLFFHGRNLFWAASASTSPPLLTLEQITGGAPLSVLATKIRSMTASTTHEALSKGLEAIAPVRDKTCLFTRVNSFPPLTLAVTDWREADVKGAEFGFGGEVLGYRHFFGGTVTEGLVVVYPPRGGKGEGEGCEVVVAVEREAVEGVLGDGEMGGFFEFRGVEGGVV
ncbi:omega-hydroxypalmitate O-feruloyl transferase [Podospora aff. communis PSN243]|uniref:Omega-hydroxypalmitate O-feruloyl transferase n=1 Tax=Podospora aff. communis PSN243 TaxID=3040156 RepID=A0AAV9FWT3_9PEZI|nr:omega-hydroxypalmitate O-feruloyl transferase [Podospora aff. communis PSN243]